MNGLKELLSDNSGGYSTMRLIALCWTIWLLAMWTKAAFQVVGIPDMPAGVVQVCLAIYGAKALQRFGEKSENS